MIAKITKGNNIDKLIRYHENKIREGVAEFLGSHNMSSENPAIFKSVLNELVKESNVEDFTFQASINLPPGETISNDKFKIIAHQYMSKMGFGNQPYFIYKHNDQEHSHIHIITVRVDDNGKSIGSFYDFLESQKITRDLEIKHNLKEVSSIKNKEDRVGEEAIAQALDRGRNGMKAYISDVTNQIKNKAIYTSIDELKEILSLKGVSLKVTNNNKGVVFGLTDDPNKHIIQRSEIYHSMSDDFLNKKITKNKARVTVVLNNSKDRLKKSVQNVLERHYCIRHEDFEKELQRVGMNIKWNKHNDGSVYGYKLYDNKSGLLLKGSQLDRNLSYEKIKHHFSETNTLNKFELSKEVRKEIRDNYYQFINNNNLKESELLIRLNKNSDFRFKFENSIVDIVNKKYLQEAKIFENINNFDPSLIVKNSMNDFILKYKNIQLYDMLEKEKAQAITKTIENAFDIISDMNTGVNLSGLNDHKNTSSNSRKNSKKSKLKKRNNGNK